jgi:hypothetical protein
MQPGVFAVSGWDLVGALSVSPDQLGFLLDDGDGRWINRGAFDLLGLSEDALASPVGLPRAVEIYGPLSEQLQDADSYASHLRRLLRAREASGIALSRLVSVLEAKQPGCVFMLLERGERDGWLLVALNFGRENAVETIRCEELAGKVGELVYSTQEGEPTHLQISDSGWLAIELGPVAAEVFLIR